MYENLITERRINRYMSSYYNAKVESEMNGHPQCVCVRVCAYAYLCVCVWGVCGGVRACAYARVHVCA